MPIRYEKKDHVAYVTIDGPGDLNPMSPPMYQDIADALEDYRDNPALWVAIITGAGEKAFSAGADIKWLLEHGQEDFSPGATIDHLWHPDAKERRLYGRGINRWIRLDLWKPVIAAINGYCLGSAFMLMCCVTDIRIAAEHAKFGLPDVKRGGAESGVVTNLPLQIPRAIAMYMILTGNMIDAHKALQAGLVSDVVPLRELMPTAEKIAKDICEIPPNTVRIEKESTMRGLFSPREEALRFAESLVTVKRLQEHLQGEDPLEGFKAFREKRKVTYRTMKKE